MPAHRLPDFLVIGAMRAGTTSLYRYLHAHPGAFLAPKELQFFTDHFGKGLDWYADQFREASDTQLLGEATADYFARRSAMDRIAQTVPDARLVVTMREPVARAWSHYWLLRERGIEDREFARALSDELAAVERDGNDADGVFYLSHGMYAHHLRRARRLFPQDQLHLTVLERMRAEPHATYRAICSFLGLDSAVVPDIVGQPVNAYVQFRSLAVRGVARRIGGLPGRVIARLNTKRGGSTPPLDDESRERLRNFYQPRVDELRDLTGDPLPEWSD